MTKPNRFIAPVCAWAFGLGLLMALVTGLTVTLSPQRVTAAPLPVPHFVPTLLSTTPDANARHVPRNTAVSASFQEAMNPSSVTPSTFVVHGSQSGLIAGTYAVSGDGQTVSLTPAASLFPGERVDAILTTGLANTSGEPLDAPHVWQFWAQAGIATGIYGFSGQPLGAANQQSYAVAAGDLNQDGFPDLVVGNAKAGGHNTIYLNDGTGSFGTISQTLPTLDSTRSVLLVDMDMDGDLDLVVGNHGKQNYIYLNNGNGTFATPGLPFGPDNDTTYSLAAGDLDGNGTIDLVVGNVITSPMGIYFNNGNATFSSQSYTLPVEGQVWSVALGDVDGDGDLDLAVGNYSNPNQIFLNDGHGNFIQPGINLRDATDLTHRLVLGDVDGDGDLDAVTANAGLNYVYYNNGDGTFSANRHPFGVSYDNSMGLALGDVDGDGDLDVVVANDVGAAKNPGESGNVVYLNDGDGTFDTTAYLFGGVSDRSQAVALADFDGDGDLDLAAVNAAMAGENPVPQQSAVYFNANASDPAITFSMQPTSTVPGGTVRYFLRFQNQGQAASHQVIITITLPAQVTITNIETSGAPVTMSGSGQIRVFQAGSLAAQASGQITVTGTLVTGLAPNTQFSATASITGSGDGYLLNNNASAVGQILNGPPNAVDDSFTIPEDSPNTALSVLANDSDPNGDPLSIYAVGIPDHGGVVNFNASTITYRPAANFAGTEVFTYTARDGRGGYGTANVIVTVTPVNDPPDARNDSATVDEDSGDTFIDVLANDTSAPDTGETLTVIAVGTPSRGGTVSFTPGGVTYRPAPNYNGVETFTYTISDGNGGTDSAQVTVTVNPVNDPPDARDDTATVDEDSQDNLINVLQNDRITPDVDEILTVIAVGTPSQGGTATLTGGQVRYTPAPNFFGIETFTYTISDGNGGTDSAQVTVTVNPVNDPPDARDDTATVNEDSQNNLINVLANDTSAPDTGETLTVTAVSTPSQGGTATLTGGQVRYTPAPNFFGIETFTYTISDGNGGTDSAQVTVTVNPVNDPPDARDDTATVNEDSQNNLINVLANDTSAPDTGETLTVTAVGTPNQGGTVTLTGGQVRYTPAPNFFGIETFTYTISDGNGGTDSAQVSVTVNPVNDPPDARDDTATVLQNAGATPINVLANDTYLPDAPETLTIVGVGVASAGGSVSFSVDQVFYTPPPNFIGTDTFAYTISDGNGGTDSAQVTVTVTPSSNPPANHPPAARDDVATVSKNSHSNRLDVLANDSTEPDTGEQLSIIAVNDLSAGGTVTFTARYVFYTPKTDFTGVETFAYTVDDGRGGTDWAVVTVTVTGTTGSPGNPPGDPSPGDPPGTGNRAPVAVNDNYSTVQGQTLTVSAAEGVLQNDQDEDGDALTAELVADVVQGTLSLQPDGSFVYTAPATFSGTTTFSYRAYDGQAYSGAATVVISVQAESSGNLELDKQIFLPVIQRATE